LEVDVSYDFYVHAVVTQDVRVFDRNYTSNCSGIWHKAFEGAGGKPEEHFADVLQAKSAKEAGELLGVMLDWIYAQSPEWVASHDAPNGWGSGAGAVKVLEELRAACVAHPTGLVNVSR
jgi:hypothetical protein